MKFAYDELPANYIRLLKLLPGEYADPLACTIQAADLDAAKDGYDALSYSWATEDGNAEQELPLLPILITRNLYDGLKRIRLVDEALCIWIDAICINQGDDAEKSVQVARMAEIYAGARSVLVWLGEGDNPKEDKMLLNIFQQFHKVVTMIESHEHHKSIEGRVQWHCFEVCLLEDDAHAILGWNTPDCPCTIDPSSTGERTKSLFEADVARVQHAMEACKAIHHVMSRRYWSRRWIVQELFHARKQYWYWGSCVTNVSALPPGWLTELWYAGSGSGVLAKVPDPVRNFQSTIDLAYSFGEMAYQITGLSALCRPKTVVTPKSISLSECLAQFRNLQCSDPRDVYVKSHGRHTQLLEGFADSMFLPRRYYALASMTTPRISINHSLSYSQVLIEVAATMLDLGGWRWVFCYAARTSADREARRC